MLVCSLDVDFVDKKGIEEAGVVIRYGCLVCSVEVDFVDKKGIEEAGGGIKHGAWFVLWRWTLLIKRVLKRQVEE